ncbi:MAG TPA: twin-arginine translocase TatA/TatE family subunit [Opitutaceae bacterium]|nr:twin-arginine translocase TatA/TatE family subunit [Opitutaceae bacterium]
MSLVLPVLAFLDVGGPEVLVIMFIILLLFGGQRLPELAKGLGKSIREFKKAASNVEDELKRAIEEAPEPSRPQPKLANPPPPAVAPPALPPADHPPEEPKHPSP